MTKKIHGLDVDGNEMEAVFASDCKLFIPNITEGFDLDISGTDGVVVEYEIVMIDGGPHMRPRLPR